MKKIMTIIWVLLLCVGYIQAEVHVLPNGHFRVWKCAKEVPDTVDTTAAMTLCDNVNSTVFRGTVNFEHLGLTRVCAVNSNYPRLPGRSALGLGGWNGITCNAGNAVVFSHVNDGMDSPLDRPLIFEVNVQSPQNLTTSDERCKRDIKPLSAKVSEIISLSPVSYRLKDGGEDAAVQFGFLAQEVRYVYPDLVYEDEEGTLSIDYTGFIPLLVDVVKTLRAQVAERESVIASLIEESGITVGE